MTTYPAEGEAIGINVALESEEQDTLDRSLAIIGTGGYSWVRQGFPWSEIEPAKGVYRWEKWDRLVAAYSNAGLKIIAVLDRPPRWSRRDNNWVNRPPDVFADYASFVQAFTSHYRGAIGLVQIWDEPNIFPNWGNRAVDPAGYVELLRIAYVAAKAGDPDVKVMIAGLAPNVEKSGRNMADTLFLDAIYRHGAREYFDVLAAKPYGFGLPPSDRRIDDTILNFSRLVRLREIMVSNGDQRKPVWAVEFGWNALPRDWQGGPSLWGQATEEEQADYVAHAIARARAEWPWLQGMVVQGFSPQYFPSNPLFGFSVVDGSFQPRPVFAAVKAAASYPYARTGEHSIDSVYVHRDGPWPATGTARIGNVGDSLKLSFEGTRLDVLVQRTPDGAVVEAILDGAKGNLSPQLDSAATFDLFDPQPRIARITLASGLQDGPHTIELRVVEGRRSVVKYGEAIIAGFVVARDAPLSVHFPLMAALIALAAGAILSFSPYLLSFFRVTWQRGKSVVGRFVGRYWRLLAFPIAGAADRFERRGAGMRSAWILVLMMMCLAVFYLLPTLPVAFVGLLAFAVLSWARPDLGLLFVVFAAPFYVLPKQIGGLRFSMVEILILTCGAIVVLRQAPASLPRTWRAAFASSPIILFLFASVISLLAAERLHEALRELRTVVVEPLIFYWMLVTVLKGKNTVWLVDVLIASALTLSLIGLFQYYFTGDVITAEGVWRMKGFYGSPNNLGLLLGRTLPFALCLGAFGSGAKRRVFYLFSMSLLIVALALTFSAGAWVGAIAALLVVLAFQNVKLCGAAATGAASLAVILPQVLKLERITSRFDLEQGTVALRLMIWQAAAKMIGDHPLLGVGLDNFLNQYPRYMLAAAWREPNLSHPHNLVLDYWLRTGLLGLAAAFWLIVRFCASAIRIHRQSRDVQVKAMALGLLGSMTDFIVHGMIDNAYFTVDLAVIFWMSLAAVRLLEGETKRL